MHKIKEFSARSVGQIHHVTHKTTVTSANDVNILPSASLPSRWHLKTTNEPQ